MTLANRSGTITTGGTAQQAVAATKGRKLLVIDNPSTESESLWVSLVGSATTDSPSLELEPGDPPLAFQGDACPDNPVSVIAATTGHKFTVLEG